MRGLKCPRCRRQTAWLRWSFNERLGRRYKRKFCSCGYVGQRTYYGGFITLEEYRQEQREMHERVEEKLGLNKP